MRKLEALISCTSSSFPSFPYLFHLELITGQRRQRRQETEGFAGSDSVSGTPLLHLLAASQRSHRNLDSKRDAINLNNNFKNLQREWATVCRCKPQQPQHKRRNTPFPPFHLGETPTMHWRSHWRNRHHQHHNTSDASVGRGFSFGFW